MFKTPPSLLGGVFLMGYQGKIWKKVLFLRHESVDESDYGKTE